jgi:hypothetical protein
LREGGNRGARLLRAHQRYDQADADWARKHRESGREFILHTPCVANVSVALADACRKHCAVGLQSSDDLLQSAPLETRSSSRPRGWRVTLRYDGSSAEIGVVPDLILSPLLPDGR